MFDRVYTTFNRFRAPDSWRPLVRLLSRTETQLVTGTLILLVMVLYPFVIKQVKDYPYADKAIGYQLMVPRGWDLEVPQKGKSGAVVLKKKYKDATTKISFQAFLGNPYGNSPVDYVDQGVLRQARKAFSEGQGRTFNLKVAPMSNFIDDREWGTATFDLDYDDLYVVYATTAGEYTLVAILEAPKGVDQVLAQKSFYQVLNFIKINPPTRKNVFIDNDIGNLF